jgi:Hg(II)-responsive transcriptional regulator
MWISEAAEQAGVNIQTLRYYERRGLLPKPPRRASGYREFPDDAVRIVRFIKRAQDLGFSLDEVEELLRLRRQSARNRNRIRAVATEKIGQIEQKVAELERMKRALQTLVHSCHAGAALDCPIIEALEK